jgi:hypothetical protein
VIADILLDKAQNGCGPQDWAGSCPRSEIATRPDNAW